jgi:hypothetical protein
MKLKVRASKCDSCEDFAVVVQVNSRDLTSDAATCAFQAWRTHQHNWDAFERIIASPCDNTSNEASVTSSGESEHAALLAQLLPTHPLQTQPFENANANESADIDNKTQSLPDESSIELWFAGTPLDATAPIGAKFGFNEKTQVNVELRIASKPDGAVHTHPIPLTPQIESAIQTGLSAAKLLAKAAHKQAQAESVSAASSGQHKQSHHQRHRGGNARGGGAGVGVPRKHAEEILKRETRAAGARNITIKPEALKRLRDDSELVQQLKSDRLRKVCIQYTAV